MREQSYFIGIDVGTKSVRAALVTNSGQISSIAVKPISVYNTKSYFYEQSSDEIWKAVCACVQEVSATVDKSFIKGIGFDATCSLVVLDRDYLPVSVGTDQNDNHNIIMWMDHRAKKEADVINLKSYKFLKYVGGKISLEMQMPKLLWLKNNLTNCWNSAKHFLDLPDYLTFKATGNLSRSLCSLVCKWTYMSDGVTQGWDEEFLFDVGLQDLMENNYSKIGQTILSPGELVGKVTGEAAHDLGLIEGTAVGASIIDAHAGGLALIFSGLEEEEEGGGDEICGRLGLISGTSTCHMCLSREPLFVHGVWGPYLSAMVPQFWLNEGGQSATGSLIDHIVLNHPAVKSCPKDEEVYAWLEKVLEGMAERAKVSDMSFLTQQIHVYPDFHGNRSPLADSSLRGMICGLSMDDGVESLALLYLGTLQALVYGSKDIVDQLENSGHKIKIVLMCGGLSNSRTFIQISADVLDRPVLIPHTKESVLLGAAMLGAAASGVFHAKGHLTPVAGAMAGKADTFNPRKELHQFHERKFQVFKKMQGNQILYNEMMRS